MKNTAQVSRSITVPAPTRGLNSEQPLADMHRQDAVKLYNVVCRPSSVDVRKGWSSHATGFGSTVETLIPYISLAGATDKLFAAAGTAIYNVTSSGAIGAGVVTGMTSARWQHTQLSNVAGNYLLLVNGADLGQQFDGTTWSAWGATGIVTSSLTQLAVWKRRVWAVEKNSFKAWYGAADAIAGALTQFSLSGVFRRGGKLLAIIPWTIDAGSGTDDALMFVSSEGEIAVYQGSDPASATTFALQGLYFVGAPVGDRFWCQFGGDVFLLTSTGLVAFSKFLRSAGTDKEELVTNRIQSLLAADIRSYGSTVGWELHYYSEENLLFLQVPAGAVGSRYQYVMNTLTGAWSQIGQTKVATYAVFKGSLYAGHATIVANSWVGGQDNDQQIEYQILPAFIRPGGAAQGVKMNLGRVVIECDYVPTFQVKLLRDYNRVFVLPSLAADSVASAGWSTGLWDSALWTEDGVGGIYTVYRKVFSLAGYANSLTMGFVGASRGLVTRVISFEYIFEVGGIL